VTRNPIFAKGGRTRRGGTGSGRCEWRFWFPAIINFLSSIGSMRATGEYWGKERTVVVTYNPRTARKQHYDFENRLFRLEETLYSMRDKVRKEHHQWKDPKQVEARYRECCEELHLPKDLYDLDLEVKANRLTMRFRKNYYRIGRYGDKFGKNIIITDNMD
jgi:transposase